MPNRFQVLYIASCVSVFTSLVLLSNYVGAKLRAAGYDVSRLILIGLPTNGSSESTAPVKFALPWGNSDSNMTTVSSFDLKDFQEKGYAQVAALVLALISSVFFYFKFGTTSEFFVQSRETTCNLTSLCRAQACT